MTYIGDSNGRTTVLADAKATYKLSSDLAGQVFSQHDMSWLMLDPTGTYTVESTVTTQVEMS
jgi:hypothetical protein